LVNSATSRTLIGRMINAPTCCALRASLTRDETHTASCSAADDASGPKKYGQQCPRKEQRAVNAGMREERNAAEVKGDRL
jgi:hypothetical protein